MNAHFSSFAELSGHLEQLGLFRIRPELGRLREVLARLSFKITAKGLPLSVQIAGTNGKGSTATFLASIAHASGLRTGLFTSPHFVSFRERIRFGTSPALEEDLLQPANEVWEAGGGQLTYFEFVTALAFVMFTADKVDLAVMETGLGGTWDAVTALPAQAVAFTPIGLDHCRILGDTIAAISADKAGAIRPGMPVFSAAQEQEALAALHLRAKKEQAPFFLSTPLDSSIPLGLAGEHQYGNAGLAVAIWRYLAAKRNWPSSEEAIQQGLLRAFIPGRLQSVPPCPTAGHPALLLDGAHNPHGMRALAAALRQRGIRPSAVIFSCLEDKKPTEMAAFVRALSDGPVFVPPISNNPRAMQTRKMVEALGAQATAVKNMTEALSCAREIAPEGCTQPVLICGSLYMLGDFYTIRPDCLEP